MSKPPTELIQDSRFQLDQLRDGAVSLRRVLLERYKHWPEDQELGPPFELGLRDAPDGLDRLIERVVASDGGARHLECVQRSLFALDHCAISYKDGFLAGTPVAHWRKDVERAFDELANVLDSADAWAESWGKTAERKHPNLALLDDLELLGTAELAQVLAVGPEQAGRRRRRGEFGEVSGKGRSKFVRSSAVREALASSTAAPDGPPPDDGTHRNVP